MAKKKYSTASVSMQPRRGRRSISETTQPLTVRVLSLVLSSYLWDIDVAVAECLAVLSNEGDGGVQTSSALSAARFSGKQPACHSARCW